MSCKRLTVDWEIKLFVICMFWAFDYLPKIYWAVVVGVEGPEDVLRKLWRVAVREKVAVDFLELFHTQLAVGAVFQKSCEYKERQLLTKITNESSLTKT